MHCLGGALPARPDRAQPPQPATRHARPVSDRGAGAASGRVQRRRSSAGACAARSRRSSARSRTARSARTGSAPGTASCVPTPIAVTWRCSTSSSWALDVGGGDHHLRAVQLPYSLAVAEALRLDSQIGPIGPHPGGARHAARHRHRGARQRAAGARPRDRPPARLRGGELPGLPQRRAALSPVRAQHAGDRAARSSACATRDTWRRTSRSRRFRRSRPEQIERLFKRAAERSQR